MIGAWRWLQGDRPALRRRIVAALQHAADDVRAGRTERPWLTLGQLFSATHGDTAVALGVETLAREGLVFVAEHRRGPRSPSEPVYLLGLRARPVAAADAPTVPRAFDPATVRLAAGATAFSAVCLVYTASLLFVVAAGGS